jgi:Domain of unknown function (DUF4126)
MDLAAHVFSAGWASGVNAYLTVAMLALLGRSGAVEVPEELTSDPILIGALVMFAIEFVADKVPLVDHANDVIQTFVRPTAGGIAFGATSSPQAVTVSDPGSFFAGRQWVPIVAGIIISFTVHGMKAAARPVINASTAGVGAPVVSTIEDFTSVALSLVAIILPVLVLVFLVALVAGFWWVLHKRAQRRAAKRAERAAREAQQRAWQGYPGGYPGGGYRRP